MCNSIYIKRSRISQHIETESKLIGIRGEWGLLNEYGVSVRVDGKVLEMNRGDSYATL